jgi:hypothetical protein
MVGIPRGVILTIALAATAIFAQNDSPATRLSGLGQPVSLRVSQDLSTKDAFIETLRAADLVGGLEIISCGESTRRVTVQASSPARTVLDDVLATDRGLILEAQSGRVLNVRLREPSFLDLRVDSFEIPALQAALTSVHRLFLDANIQADFKAANLVDRVPTGMQAVPKPGTPLPVQPPPTQVGGLTVRQVLNVIAIKSGQRAWIYEERRCGAEGTFTIAFVHDDQFIH